jgi:hypothetical protein
MMEEDTRIRYEERRWDTEVRNLESGNETDADQKKCKMNRSTNRIIRLLIYFIIVFIAAFLYSYFKKN